MPNKNWIIGLASTALLASLAIVAGESKVLAAQNPQQTPRPPLPPAIEQPGGDDFIYKVRVDLVLLSVAVTDHSGHYIKDLKPTDFRIYEDGVPQKLALFSEGGGQLESLLQPGELPAGAEAPAESTAVVAPGAGSSVFILMDTSNYMYKNFALAQDSIADFIRSLDPNDQVAIYGFSRNLMRARTLTRDHLEALSGLRTTVAGDDTALYNSLLLTLQDAQQVSGRKVVVVFSNGPDNGSMVSPETVREMAESAGVPIYMISTSDATKDEISATVFRRITDRTGGKSYFARNWRAQSDAFVSIREDLGHLYSLSYYPSANANMGWRRLTVELTGENAKKYRVRTRTGYLPHTRPSAATGTGGNLP
jgi:Ca-activated chloride channel family protein